MKELTFMKSELASVRGILLSFKLKGKQSRLRMRLVREIDSALAELDKEEQLLLDENALKDDQGEFIKIKREVNGQMLDYYDFDDESAFIKEMKLLHDEPVVVDQEKFKEELEVILTAIDEFDGELSGQEAIAHDLLYQKISDSLD